MADTLQDALRHEFLNRVRSLYNIDKHVIDQAFVAAGGEPMTVDQWRDFRDDPAKYFIRSDDATGQVIWACVEARQPKAGASRG